MLTRDASCDGGSTKKWCGSRDHRKPVRLIDSGAVLIAFRIGRTQVDLRRRNVGMSQFLPQGFDVNAVLVPPCSVQNAKRMAGLLRLLDGVPHLVRLVDETIDDPVQVFVHRLCRWGWENQCIIRRVAAILLEASEQRVADSDGPLFIVLRFEAELCFEANRNRLVFPIDVHPLGDRSLSNAEPVPTRKRVRASFIELAT